MQYHDKQEKIAKLFRFIHTEIHILDRTFCILNSLERGGR